jgi:hypothetical protein
MKRAAAEVGSLKERALPLPVHCSKLLDRLSVGVEETDFSEPQLFDPSLDFGAVANDDPNQVIRMDDGFCAILDVARF